MRDFDFVMFEHDVLLGLGGLSADMLSGLPNTVVGGLVATQTSVASLTINIASGRIYQFALADATAVGSIPQDASTIVQQGDAAAQTVTLVAPAAGQSRWNLIQAQFSQVDAVRDNDPNGGIVPFYNAANPTQPNSNSINTVRKAVCILQVITGAAATTGSEQPPQPTGGWVPLYLIDLAGGQTQVTTSQILQTGPSIGTGVPSNYSTAPFLAGFLASHHNGSSGQAPKIKLTTEVQGVLPYANMSPVRLLLSSNLTVYVNASTGSDTNSGLAPSTPFRTLQAAANLVQNKYDYNGFTPTISVANGAYTAGIAFNGSLLGTSAAVQLIGNIAQPQSVTISATSAHCVFASGGAAVNVQGFSLTATGTAGVSGNGITATSGANVTFSAIIFSTCVYHMSSAIAATVQLSGTKAYTITGGGLAHYASDANGFLSIISGAVTLTGTPNFSVAFASCSRNATLAIAAAGFPAVTFTGAATGTRHVITTNGIVTVLGNVFPGSIAGTVTTGGQLI